MRKLLLEKNLACNTVGYLYNTVHYIMLLYTCSTAMTAAEHNSDFELTKDPVTRASYGVFVVEIWGT